MHPNPPHSRKKKKQGKTRREAAKHLTCTQNVIPKMLLSAQWPVLVYTAAKATPTTKLTTSETVKVRSTSPTKGRVNLVPWRLASFRERNVKANGLETPGIVVVVVIVKGAEGA